MDLWQYGYILLVLWNVLPRNKYHAVESLVRLNCPKRLTASAAYASCSSLAVYTRWFVRLYVRRADRDL
jgi:hypothetical protein